ncbi:hypothetical protein LTS08_007398 [Lithohypha guttulata]|uniref:uncharacterized protein n=1 Tax=Lithohypha guttulata TaxID=1690604 RepID=UPI002DE06DD5|nr:hypothetical protein LTR51_002233 [Lithohypha guttulata]KAK5096908.1 hypothetical protein LTS08_007398 [Lithohypha guttulata]
MAQPGSSSTWQAPQPTFWEKTKGYGNTAYNKALLPGFNKAYAVVDKLGAPVNRLSNKVGSEAFWPTTLDKECEKCARILRTFCRDGFYDQIEEDAAQKASEDRQERFTPKGRQRNLVKIPAKVIQNAVGLAIFTTMRTGWVLGGSGGAGVVVARHPETREWSPPSGIHIQNMSIGFLIGVDIFDSVLVINSYKALDAFSRNARVTLGAELGVVAGPVGAGGELDMEIHKKPAPVWSYVKSRGLYAGIALAGNAIIERTDENAVFYGYQVSGADILSGKVRHPPVRDFKILWDTLAAAQGDNVDESLLPSGESPADLDVDFTGSTFGIPAPDDDDPYGVKALEAEGLPIREAGTHLRPSAELFEFNPAPTSPIYKNYRQSLDGSSIRRKTDSWRNSTTSVNSVTRATQTASDEDIKTDSKFDSRSDSMGKDSPQLPPRPRTEPPLKEALHEDDPIHQAAISEDLKEQEEKHESDKEDFSDIDSDAEIATAVSTIARPRVVQVAKPLPPALPPRNPGRSAPQPSFFTVKFRTAQNLPEGKLVLRTSMDNWEVDRRGEMKDGTFFFKLDSKEFTDTFECKFVLLPNRWMHDPNLVVTSPAPNEDITFTDSRVVFDPPTEEDNIPLEAMQTISLNEQKPTGSVRSDADEDAFVSVPPTPTEHEKSFEKLNGA